jgi:hypothetical protein
MIECFPGILDGYRSIGHGVAFETKRGRIRLGRLHSALEMTEEADFLGNGDMRSHNHLRMAARTAKFFAPPFLSQMRSVVEGDALEINFSVEKPRFVTPFSQT